MKKFSLLIVLAIVLLSSCEQEDRILELKVLPIKEVVAPTSFKYQTVDTLAIKYTLPNACYSFKDVYYRINKNSRTVAINAFQQNDIPCSQATIDMELKLPINVLQDEEYVFKIYKGKDSNGDSIFDEIRIPVIP